MTAQTYNLADLFEAVADAIPDREVLVSPARRLTYAQLDDRATRLANHLAGAGVVRGDFVGLQLLNGTEYVEGMLAAAKLGAVPVNVNYRYVERELEHLFADAGLVALVFHRQFGARIAPVAAGLPGLTTLVVVEDGTDRPDIDGADIGGAAAYEDALAAASADRAFEPRSSDDVYCAYTGGTTGMPKGVLWRHQDIFFAAMGGGDPFQSGNHIAAPDELVGRLGDAGLVQLPTPPFMHVSAHWAVFFVLYGGGKVIIAPPGPFSPGTIWGLVQDEKVNILTLVGDAMARPLVEHFVANPGFDPSSLIVIGSGGAILSPACKAQLKEALPNVMIVDGFGSSETGTLGNQAQGDASGGSPRFAMNAQTAVLDDDLRPVEPGSGVTGRLARKGYIPLGYHNDPEKTARTFVTTDDGIRWVLPGDMATVDADGSVVLLGRGSGSINTGGEKVFPEEVEAALKAHPDVFDAVVVGLPDPQWGAKVVAIVQPRVGKVVELDQLRSFCREHLAGYKIPRELVVSDAIVRSPAGKADYRWAGELAEKALTSEGR